VAGRQSGVPFDSVPSRARCILAHNNTGRAWAIIGLDPDATQTDDLLPSAAGFRSPLRGEGDLRCPSRSKLDPGLETTDIWRIVGSNVPHVDVK
jgi:hypothetical protein